MSLKAERDSIVEKFMAGWDSTKTPVKFDNANGLAQGSTSVKDETKLAEWCSLSILPNDAVRGDINAIKLVRYTGNIVVNVFVKVGNDTDRALELASKAMELLQHSEMGDVITRSAIVTNMGQRDGSSFYQMSVRVPYYRDQYFTN